MHIRCLMLFSLVLFPWFQGRGVPNDTSIVSKMNEALLVCVGYGNLVGVDHCLLHHADPNTRDEFGDTPLMLAVMADNVRLVAKLLADKRTNFNATNKHEGITYTPLLLAVAANHPDIVKVLLAVPGINMTECNPFMIAVNERLAGIVELFLALPKEKRDAVVYKRISGITPLLRASDKGYFEIVALLLNAGIHPCGELRCEDSACPCKK